MITLTNDQMVEISGGWNPDALKQDVCLNCYRALAQAGILIAEGSAFTLVGSIIAAIASSIDVAVACNPCLTAVMGE